MADRVKPIILTDEDNGRQYTLEFNRDVVKRVERNGFSIFDCEKHPSLIEDLFYYSFLMHHERDVSKKKAQQLFEAIGGLVNAPKGLIERLNELYFQAYDTLADGDGKNVKVTVQL